MNDLKVLLKKLVSGQNLTLKEAYELFEQSYITQKTNVLSAALAVIASRNIDEQELTGFAQFMQNHMQKININYSTIDIVGTGGDFANTINISTCSAILASSLGVKVAKHGNKAVSSQSGSADVLEKLGYQIESSQEKTLELLDKFNFCFIYARLYHPIMKFFSPIRQELGIPTAFNLLGPLLNPTQVKYIMMGVMKEELVELMAKTWMNLGGKKGWFFSSNGTDELTCIGKTKIYQVQNNKISSFDFNPQDYNLEQCSLDDLKGGDAQYNAHKLQSILQGEKSKMRDTIVLNASVCLYLKTDQELGSCINQVKQKLDSGEAYKHFQQMIEFNLN